MPERADHLANPAEPRFHSIGQGHMPAHWALARHSHATTHELVLVIDGAVETDMDGGACVSKAGTLKHHPLGLPHAERGIGGKPISLIWIHGTAPELDAAFPRQVADQEGRLLHLMRWLASLDQGRADDRLLTDRLFAALLATCLRTPAADPLVESVRAFVREHLADPLSLEGLAHAAGLSSFHFARRFRSATGLSPMAYVRRERVEAARRMVTDTPMPLREIAPLTGFRDEFHLSRSFRRVTGVPAGRFRRR